MARKKKPLNLPVFDVSQQVPKGRLPDVMLAIIAVLLLLALSGVFLLYQATHEPLSATGKLSGAAPKTQPQAQVIECSGSVKQNCSASGCTGTKTCYGGRYSKCILPRKICVPGAKIGCSTDACKFGYATCNPCGTAYGECLPRPGYNATNSTNSTPPCTSATCQ
ncbi:MAG: hypothetical protein NTV88_04430 [Candidatus Micrarchaeota archaeon]|nr:hypothetical protein [Candidatus Micrarchaeota archaeon]